MTTNNCRIEGLTESRLYKDPLSKGQRCAVLCEGFYEWKQPENKGGSKQPYIIYFPQPEGVSTCIILYAATTMGYLIKIIEIFVLLISDIDF